MKTVSVSTGKGLHKHEQLVQLQGYKESEPLRPRMARRALEIAGFYTGTAMSQDIPAVDPLGYDCYFWRTYRVYPNSARRIS